MEKKGKVIIISGPSGVGKTTLAEKLLKDKKFIKKIVRSISVTTRPPRRGEKNGRDYYFISEKQFLYRRRAGWFLESKKIYQYYYGTPLKKVRCFLKKGVSVLLCIDVQGAKEVFKKYPDAISIFVKPPNFEELKRRLCCRQTESKKDIDRRLSVAREETENACQYRFVIVNDYLSVAYEQLVAVVSSQLFSIKGASR